MSERHDAVPGAPVPLSRHYSGGHSERRFLRAAHPVLQVTPPRFQFPSLLHTQPAHVHRRLARHLHSQGKILYQVEQRGYENVITSHSVNQI